MSKALVGLYYGDKPLNDPPPFFVWFVPSSRIFLVKAVYMLIGSSGKIPVLGTNTTLCM